MSFTYRGLEAQYQRHIVTAEEVEQQLRQMQQQAPRYTAVEDRATQLGDEVVLDYAGFCNGEQFAGGTAENQTLVLGSGTFIPGFEEQLVDKAVGEKVIVKVTFPEQYHSEALAGKDAEFHCTIHQIRIKSQYELDDTFAKELCARKPYTFRTDFTYATCYVTLEGDPRIAAGGSFKVHARFVNNYHEYANPPYLMKLRWLLPEGFTVKGPKSVILPEYNYASSDTHCPGEVEVDFEIIAPESPEAINRCVLEALAEGRFTAGYMPITLLA